MERLGVTLIASAGKGAELDAFPWLRWFGNETYERLVKFSKLRDDLYGRLKQRTLEEMGTLSPAGGGGRGRLGGDEGGRVGMREEMAGEAGEIHERIGGKGVESKGRELVGSGRRDVLSEGDKARIEEEGGGRRRRGGGTEERRIEQSVIDGAGEAGVGRGRTERTGGRGEGEGQSGAIIQTLLTMVEEWGGSGGGFGEEFIKGTFTDLILGGTASTTNLIYAYLNIMLHHRSAYDRVKAEISNCLFDLDLDLIAHRPCLSDKGTMPYTQASVLELLRYVSIAPFTVPHQALVNTTIAGYKVPQGTDVLCNLWAVLHDEGLWEDPWRFRPERFLTEDGASLVAPDHPNRRRLIAFGAGPRHCIGEVFAHSRLFLIVTSLLRDFDLHPDPEAASVSCDPRTYSLGIALYPRDFKLRLTPTRFYAMQTARRLPRPSESHG